jgi:hypothetical protein
MFLDHHCEDWGLLPEGLWQPLREFVATIDYEADTSARHEIAFARPENRILMITQMGRTAHRDAAIATAQIFEYLDAAFGSHPGDPLHGRGLYRAELSFVGPGSSVLEHHDPCRFHQVCHRLHVPIVTRGSVIDTRWFTQSSWSAHTLRAGRLYQLNNRVPHRLTNWTDSLRVHLIMDYAPVPQLERWKLGKSDSHAMVPCRETDREYHFVGPTHMAIRRIGEVHE